MKFLQSQQEQIPKQILEWFLSVVINTLESVVLLKKSRGLRPTGLENTVLFHLKRSRLNLSSREIKLIKETLFAIFLS